jgi:hypothetical protein
VQRTEPGEWLNYTRQFSENFYAAYLRAASFGATAIELHEVTSDPTQPDQTTSKLGTFNVPNLMARYNYQYIPLVNDQAAAVTLSLSGTKTLRLQMAGTAGEDAQKTALNYILLVPQTDPPAPEVSVHSAALVAGPYALDPAATIDTVAGQFTVPIGAEPRFFRVAGPSQLRILEVQRTGTTLIATYGP